MPTRIAFIALAALALVAARRSTSTQPVPYTAGRGRIASRMQPNIELRIDTTLTYVGSQRWPLYDLAQAEQHLYVQRSATGVSRFLWVQFEEYLPSSNGRYDYSGDAPLSAFGRELRVSKRLLAMPTTESRPESDGAYARRLLRDHGITLPAQMLYERFIYLPDSTHRRELMVIYAEDATALGSPPAPTLDSLLTANERRALRSFAIVPRR